MVNPLPHNEERRPIRCEHGHVAAVILPTGVEIRLRDDCKVLIPWPRVEVRVVKELS